MNNIIFKNQFFYNISIISNMLKIIKIIFSYNIYIYIEQKQFFIDLHYIYNICIYIYIIF